MNTKEFNRIKTIQRLLRSYDIHSANGLTPTVGIEDFDDCAVMPLNDEHDLIVGSDFVRGERFGLYELGLLNAFDIGAYLVAANVSDLAAMGASPFGLTTIFRYTEDTSDKHFEEVFCGIINACDNYRIPLLGGDTGTYDTPVLSATAFGTCRKGHALLRSTGICDDLVFLTDMTGVAGAAYRYFYHNRNNRLHDLSPSDETELIGSWKNIHPAIEQGIALSSDRLSACAIDTSDGLGMACSIIAQMSDVDVILRSNDIPISDLLVRVADSLGASPLQLALGVSVDFCLLFTAHQSNKDAIQTLFSKNGWNLHEIGYLTAPRESANTYIESGDSITPIDEIENYQ